MKIYGLASCDTCRKARKALPKAQFVDVRSDGLPHDLLEKAIESFGQALLNTRSKTWRDLPADQRQGALKDVIAVHPLVMKRPLIEQNGTLYLGWTGAVQAALGVTA